MSENDIVNAIVHRLGMTRMAELVRTYGIDIVDMELSMAASFYGDRWTDIGTSDVSHICNSFLLAIGEPSYFQEIV